MLIPCDVPQPSEGAVPVPVPVPEAEAEAEAGGAPLSRLLNGVWLPTATPGGHPRSLAPGGPVGGGWLRAVGPLQRPLVQPTDVGTLGVSESHMWHRGTMGLKACRGSGPALSSGLHPPFLIPEQGPLPLSPTLRLVRTGLGREVAHGILMVLASHFPPCPGVGPSHWPAAQPSCCHRHPGPSMGTEPGLLCSHPPWGVGCGHLREEPRLAPAQGSGAAARLRSGKGAQNLRAACP